MHTSLDVVNCFLHGEENKQGDHAENDDANTLDLAKNTVTLGGQEVIAVISFVHLGDGLIDVLVFLVYLVAFATSLVVALVLVHIF
jgi:hypothetical protein